MCDVWLCNIYQYNHNFHKHTRIWLRVIIFLHESDLINLLEWRAELLSQPLNFRLETGRVFHDCFIFVAAGVERRLQLRRVVCHAL